MATNCTKLKLVQQQVWQDRGWFPQSPVVPLRCLSAINLLNESSNHVLRVPEWIDPIWSNIKLTKPRFPWGAIQYSVKGMNHPQEIARLSCSLPSSSTNFFGKRKLTCSLLQLEVPNLNRWLWVDHFLNHILNLRTWLTDFWWTNAMKYIIILIGLNFNHSITRGPERIWHIYILWVWVNTYRYIFSGMNIHLPAILMFTRGTRVLTHPHI